MVPHGDLDAQLRLWRGSAIVALTLAITLAWVYSAVRQKPSMPLAPKVAASRLGSGAPGVGSPVMQWGRLEIDRIILERPDQLFSDVEAYFGEDRLWRFGEARAELIEQLFQGAGLDDAARSWLLDRQNWRINDGMIQMAPPEELLWRLSPNARGRIYSFLTPIPGNPFKTNPFKIATNLAPMWFADSEVSAGTERLIRSLTYQLGPMLCFSDPGLLADRIPEAEKRPVLKALSRQPAQRAFLRIEYGDDLGPLANYWAAGGKIPKMLPLLESLRASTNGGRIDLAYLMPRFCRERLFTFPDRATVPDTDLMDCFWTALNFFHHPPQERFADIPLRLRYLQSHYEPMSGESRFGDLLVLYDESQNPMHVCVYIAGDTVFTKNGGTINAPWVFMSYRDMLGYYSMDGTPTMRVLRKRQMPPS